MSMKIIVGNKVFTGKLVEKVYKRSKHIKVKVKGKQYEYDTEQYFVHVYIPKELANKKFLLVAIDDSDIVHVDENTVLLKIN